MFPLTRSTGRSRFFGVPAPAAPSSVEYLVVAGGGAGGNAGGASPDNHLGGGGGAGGFRTATGFAVAAGTPYTVTIGAGGSTVSGIGNSGSNSVFSTITSTGGGGGGYSTTTARNGGSGGGGGTEPFTPLYGSPGTGTAGQGNDGGTANQSNRGGGGGGASAVGGANNGGAGTASSITGVSVTYAGGGGGAQGTGGAGGGGAGGPGATAGSANTGGGGGGSWQQQNGGAGGSGVVIIAYANTFPDLSSISGGLTYTLDTVGRSGFKVYRFTAGTGTIQW